MTSKGDSDRKAKIDDASDWFALSGWGLLLSTLGIMVSMVQFVRGILTSSAICFLVSVISSGLALWWAYIGYKIFQDVDK